MLQIPTMATLENGISSQLYGAWLYSESDYSLKFFSTPEYFSWRTVEDLKILEKSNQQFQNSISKVSSFSISEGVQEKLWLNKRVVDMHVIDHS